MHARLTLALTLLALPLASPALSDADRATRDRPDEQPGYQVHLMYLVPSDGADRRMDVDGTLARSADSWNTWLAKQTGGSRLRLDTYDGEPDVTFWRAPATEKTIAAEGVYVRDWLERAIQAAGFKHPKKLYAVYYDGYQETACGGGAWPPALPGRVAALYLKGEKGGCARNAFTPDISRPGYLEFAMLHELFHTIGMVPAGAPHHHRQGHSATHPGDLMYAGDKPWWPTELDVSRADYYGHGVAGRPDAARSVFMDPLPARAERPPAWERGPR